MKNTFTKNIIAISILLISFVKTHGSTISGTIDSNTTIPAGEIIIEDDLIVPNNITLTIEPGARLLFTSNSRLIIKGELNAIGTMQDSIIFTRSSYENPSWRGIDIIYEGDNSSCTIAYAIIEKSWQGALEVKEKNITLSHSTIRNNYATHWTLNSANAGGITFENSNSQVTNCFIHSNTTHNETINNFSYFSYISGGIVALFSDIIIDHSYISNNTFSRIDIVTYRGGGGGVSSFGGSLQLNNSTIESNTAFMAGGLLTAGTCDAEVNNSFFLNNDAKRGGAIIVDGTSHLDLNNSIINGNSALSGSAILFGEDVSGKLTNSIITYNIEAADIYNDFRPGLEGIVCTWTSPTVTNCIFWGNEQLGDEIEDICINSFLQNTKTNINGDATDVLGNMNLDPMMVDPENGNFQLQVGSPCIDAGENHTQIAYDYNGIPRILGNTIDIGPYEFVPEGIFDLVYQRQNETNIGALDGAINITVYGGIPPYSFNWSNGSTSEDISNLQAGDYEVTVTDQQGSTINYSMTVSITNIAPFQLSYLKEDASKEGATNGSIDIIVSGGVPPYNFSWSNGSTSEDISNLQAGDYEVIVTDLRGIEISKTISISSRVFHVSYEKNNESIIGAYDGGIDITIHNGIPPYTTVWNNGSVSEDLNNISSGYYEVIVTDNDGDIITEKIHIHVDDVNDTTFYSFSGKVYVDESALSSGTVLLINKSGGELKASAYASVINGTFAFDQVISGDYILYAIPYGSEEDYFFPTYYPRKLLSEEAYSFSISNNTFGVDIHLVEKPILENGDGHVSGILSFLDTPDDEAFYQNNNDYLPSGIMGEVTIMLMDENNDAIYATTANASGAFNFNDIAAGNYTLHVQRHGFEVATEINITISNNGNTSLKGLDVQLRKLVIASTSITVINESSRIYPNPVISEMNIENNAFEGSKVTVQIFDLMGQKIAEVTTTGNNGTIKIDGLELLKPGSYIGKINSPKHQELFRFFKTE